MWGNICSIDIQEYRSLMSSSSYRRVTDEIENGNLAMVLATDIQYIRFKSCGKYLCTLYKCMGVCLQILQTEYLKVKFQRRLVADKS